MTIDPDSFRSVLGRFASGITVVTTLDADGRDLGMTVSAFDTAGSVRPRSHPLELGGKFST